MKIIVECGVNFSNLDEAYDMIREAKRIGAFLCKFQLYNKENLKDVEVLKVREFLRSIMLSEIDAMELYEYGHCIGQEVFFTPMYTEIIPFLETLGVNYYKIRFKDHENTPLIKKVLDTGRPCFISINFTPQLKTRKIKYLYCVPRYPADYNFYPCLLGTSFEGYSDHTSDLRLLTESLEYNVGYFEKHVKLDGTTPLEDKWSVSFSELAEVFR